MPLSSWRSTVCLFAPIVLLGCSSPTPPAPPMAPPTAEERFDTIVQTLKRRIENEPMVGGAGLDSPPGTPIADSTARVSHELTPPAGEGEPYRAVVHLTTTSKVTVVLPPPSEEDQKKDQAKTNAQVAELKSDLEGVGDLDALVVPTTEGLNSRFSKSPIHEITPEESRSSYELEFRNGRWELLTELDEENEPFYALAIEFALKTQ